MLSDTTNADWINFPRLSGYPPLRSETHSLRFQFADMVRDGAVDAPSCGSWADCVSGTVEPKRYLDMLAAAGFRDAEMMSFTGYRTAPTTIGTIFRAVKPRPT